MIDWVSLFLPYSGPDVCGGRVLVVDPGGEIRRETLQFLVVESASSSEKTSIKTMPGGLWMSGNPSKWLQGHNVFGSDNLPLLVEKWGSQVLQAAGIFDFVSLSALLQRNYRLTRVDINYLYDLGSKSQCYQWIEAAAVHGKGKYQKTEITKGTVYIGKNSKRHSFKVYYKGDEILKNRPSIDCDDTIKLLQEYCVGKLRFELTLRGPALKDLGLEYGINWCVGGKNIYCGGTANGVFNMRIQKINLTGSYEVNSEELKLLPKKYQSVYQLWMKGADMRDLYSRRTFYRHKKYFIDNFGINIEIQRRPERGEVIPLIRVLEAKPAAIPSWAFDRGLIAA